MTPGAGPLPEDSILNTILCGRDLIEFLTSRRETAALLSELRRNSATRAILDGHREGPCGGLQRVSRATVQRSPTAAIADTRRVDIHDPSRDPANRHRGISERSPLRTTKRVILKRRSP